MYMLMHQPFLLLLLLLLLLPSCLATSPPAPPAPLPLPPRPTLALPPFLTLVPSRPSARPPSLSLSLSPSLPPSLLPSLFLSIPLSLSPLSLLPHLHDIFTSTPHTRFPSAEESQSNGETIYIYI